MAGNAAATGLVQRQPEGPGSIPGTETGTPAGGTTATTTPERRTLRFGSTGDDVKLLQMKLRHVREREHDRDVTGRVRVDGIFGPLTREDVMDFQSDTGLEVDGVVGPRTWHALDSLVTATPDERQEAALGDQFEAALALMEAGRYDEALAIFEPMIAGQATPERIGPLASNAGRCHQQRGRFGLAVARYELALGGRFNQEGMRAVVLDNLLKARQGVFLDAPAPDPEPLPPGAEAATAVAREGGGVTEREPVRAGDTGPSVDLFKGKLAHLMVGWQPEMPDTPAYDAQTVEKTRQFQEACGLTSSGEGDAPTWHALDSFTGADVPFSIVQPLFARARAAVRVADTDPLAALPLFEGVRDDARSLRLTEIVKNTEAWIGRVHHKQSHFAEAVEHYTLYLDRNIPYPRHYGAFMEDLRRARQGLPAG